jgi:hypothetical protein
MNLAQWIRRVMVLAPPLFLGTLEIWHPSAVIFGQMVQSPELASWWLTLHLIQLPLFGLLAMSIYYLIQGVSHIIATISRVAIWFFLIFYTAFDAVAGIATGILFKKMQALNLTNESDPMFDMMYEIFLSIFLVDVHGGSWIANIAVVSWITAAIAAAVALYLKGYNRIGVALIVLSAIVFHSHSYPYGTIGMYLLAAGSYLIVFHPWSFTEAAKPDGIK